MIEGMEILKQTEIIETVTPWYFWVLFILVGIVLARVMRKWFAGRMSVVKYVIGIFAMVIAIMFSFQGLYNLLAKDVSTGLYEYTVYVDDADTAKDIYSQYEVVDIDGNIWIIQDKEE